MGVAMRNYDLTRVSVLLYDRCWAITEDKLTTLIMAFRRRQSGRPAMMVESPDDGPLPPNAKLIAGLPVMFSGATAIVPLHGVITQRPSVMSRYSGGTSTDQFTSANMALVSDPNVKGIIWDINSPGGSVFGVEEAFQRLYSMRGVKPIVAMSNSVCCSAAYYLAAAADRIVATPSSLTGNIGVIHPIVDSTKKEAQSGVKIEYISAGKYKSEGYGKTTDEYRASVQAEVDDYYAMFVNSVAKGRGVKPDDVRNGMGEGRALTAIRAKDVGLVDSVGTIETILQAMPSYDGKGKANELRNRIRIAKAQP